ncbi:centriole, cilia and spindle-associated protein [Limanda limanda]|uniref:centriole, cilia and spindle-associated protein n=1 Tax=Limanda limanda TaxID=27771 RepID=UPI0029C7C781|nr:centriole, cilia and spindle-associated protein [Limanda limanda]
MVTKTIRTEYMKKFRDPRWETFSKCYEDALRYRLTRRVMEHAHRPWLWEGWDSGSDSSGWSTPRLTRNKVSPLSLPPPPASSGLKTSPGPEPAHQEAGGGGAGDTAPNTAALVENGVNEPGAGSVKPVPNASRASEDTATDDGPADTASSDGEPVKPAPKRRHRRRAPPAEPGRQDGSSDDQQAAVRKAARAKSQPPISSEEKRRASSRLDGSEGRTQLRTNDSQTRRESDKRSNNVERRRARSADLDKVRRSQLAVVDDRWMTEYMSCFSARRR